MIILALIRCEGNVPEVGYSGLLCTLNPNMYWLHPIQEMCMTMHYILNVYMHVQYIHRICTSSQYRQIYIISQE